MYLRQAILRCEDVYALCRKAGTLLCLKEKSKADECFCLALELSIETADNGILYTYAVWSKHVCPFTKYHCE